MKEVTGSAKRISGADFRVLRATQTVGVLIECGFISNANERGQLQSSKYHQKLAVKICDGIENIVRNIQKIQLIQRIMKRYYRRKTPFLSTLYNLVG